MSQVDEAALMAERLLAPLPRRWGHVQGVAATAAVLATGLSDADADTVVASAWLHDIGYSPELVDSGFHPLDGARWLEANGFSGDLIALVAHHTGARIEAEERGLLPLWTDLPDPRADLLQLLTAADISTSPEGDPVQPRLRIAEILTRYPESDPVYRAVTRSGHTLIATTDDVLTARGLTVDKLAAARAR